MSEPINILMLKSFIWFIALIIVYWYKPQSFRCNYLYSFKRWNYTLVAIYKYFLVLFRPKFSKQNKSLLQSLWQHLEEKYSPKWIVYSLKVPSSKGKTRSKKLLNTSIFLLRNRPSLIPLYYFKRFLSWNTGNNLNFLFFFFDSVFPW